MRCGLLISLVASVLLSIGCGRDPVGVGGDATSGKGGRSAPGVSVVPGERHPDAVHPPSGVRSTEYLVIETWAGTGVNGMTPDGTTLEEAQLAVPMDVAFASGGTPYIVDWNNHRILEVRDGKHYTVIGNGSLGSAVDGPATDLPGTPELEGGINHPTDVVWDPQGRVVMAAWHNSKIMRCDLGLGLMERIVGLVSDGTNGERCWNGDANPALESCVNMPAGVGFDAAGNLYVADQKNLRIRRVAAIAGEITDESLIETVVGTGNPGPLGSGSYNGDGLPGTETDLASPAGQSAPPSNKILVRPDGVIYFADSLNNLVRRLGADGIVHTVAGGGEGIDPVTGMPRGGFSGDGGPAAEATLYFPTDVAMDSQGNLYIADCFNSSIRKVDPDGIITTFAGRGARDPLAPVLDGVHPTQAWLDRPYGVAVDADDNVYIADTFHDRIRVVRK